MSSIPRKNGKVRKPSDIDARSSKRRPTALAVLLFSILLLWSLGALYITTNTPSTHSNNIVGGKMLSPPHQQEIQNHPNIIKLRGANKKRKIVTDNTNIIDMRNLTATLPFEDVDGGVWKQGWDIQPDNNAPLTVFVVPHSHCDPGWIKTFDDYFQSQTKAILTTVVKALHKDPSRKFVWAEISYFEWWWREQSSEMQEITLNLLRNKQLEFVTGGWVQPDEANTQLYAMEIQLEEGHDFIRQTLGDEFIPKYAWSIDPFGYSPTMAFLLNKYGFEGMLIQRVHYAVKKELAKRKHLEFMWRQTWDDTGKHDIFTHVMPFFSYDVPHTCGPDPSVCCQFDFARIKNFGGCPWRKNPQVITKDNVKERSMLLLDQYRKKAELYRSNVVIAPLGDDFRYMTEEEAESQFQNYQKIMNYVNDNVDNVSIQFGTLGDYFDKVQGTFNVPVLKGSFFTYADREQDYWSGYFTSRVFDKALDRKLERVLYAAESLGLTKEALRESRRALSLFQHHDGVTGTAKDHVVRDYASRIHNAIRQVQASIIDKLNMDSNTEACWQSDAPRGLSQNLCEGEIKVYNPLETSQYCGGKEVHGYSTKTVELPCEIPRPHVSTLIHFDSLTGLMTHPVKEQWMVWKVREGGAYLFLPGHLIPYEKEEVKVELGGYIVTTPQWKRSIVIHEITDEFGTGHANVIDFIYETDLQNSNEEWLVRFSSSVKNEGVFHTDLNGFNFDTHCFRKDLPIQSQVFPMPTLASIEDDSLRMTVLSEHAQGTASLEDGSIDVWLDRRLSQDDGRGLFQGVTDNVPTRTRLRLVLEHGGYDTNREFDITPLCRRMWDELNHPLEMFGEWKFKSAHEARVHADDESSGLALALKSSLASRAAFDAMTDPEKVRENISDTLRKKFGSSISYLSQHNDGSIVPFVYMVYKRVDLLKMAIDSLRASDFDRKRVPLIISHDGHVPEVVSYVEHLKSDFRVIQIYHPYSCYEHPNTFPGNDESLKENYAGDLYGNVRNGMVTCCKHHFTWMIKTVFSMDIFGQQFDAFALFEEDYVVSPTIYESVISGLTLLKKLSHEKDDFFGIVLEGRVFNNNYATEGWQVKNFSSGPVALSRRMYESLVVNARDFCTYDDYNWDWSIVHLMNKGLLPSRVLYPTIPQTMHVGIDNGIHSGKAARWQLFAALNAKFPGPFHGTKLVGETKQANQTVKAPFGGWGHTADHKHCLELLSGATVAH